MIYCVDVWIVSNKAARLFKNVKIMITLIDTEIMMNKHTKDHYYLSQSNILFIISLINQGIGYK